MKRASILAFIAHISSSYAAPADPRAVPGSIGTSCTNVRIDNDFWLIGECLTGNADERITTGSNLFIKISNTDGNLTFGGARYADTCVNCKLESGGSNLTCECRPHSGARKLTTLNLDEHIGIYSGHMLSDLRGPPLVPISPSKYPWPANMQYAFGGNATCPGSPGPNNDFCNDQSHSCTNTASNDFSEGSFYYSEPIVDCYVPRIYLPYDFTFEAIKLVGGGAWELTGYADVACTVPIVKISPDEMGTCKGGLHPPVKAVTSRPIFNGDPH